MEEKTSKEFAPKKQLTKGQFIAVMAVGGLMLLLSIVIPTAPDSTGHTVKIIVGILGLLVLCVGAYFRPMRAPKNPKE
jgi:protein-S-isoprenylcysteine O-methyltransferase Ste14